MINWAAASLACARVTRLPIFTPKFHQPLKITVGDK